MGFTSVSGIDFTLPAAPPLTQAPLSLPDLSLPLVDIEGLTERLRIAVEKAASKTMQLSDLNWQIENIAPVRQTVPNGQTAREVLLDEERDGGGQIDSVNDAKRTLAQLQSEYATLSEEVEAADAFASDLAKQLADLSRWEHGFVYLPELSNGAALEVFEPDSGATKNVGSNQAPAQSPFYWYDPFIVVGRDERSTFGWPMTDFASRAMRATRALVGHEEWQVEQEFWSGVSIPTNYHLTASPNTPTTSAHRTIDAWPNPTPAPGTVLGTAVGLAQSLAALDQAIAESDAGTGMIHATPYLMQEWMKTYPFIRDPSDPGVYTVNHNLMIPGYGYGGTGPDQASRTPTDGVANGTTTFTSATADFTDYDIGRPISGTDIAAGTYIEAIVSATQVTLSQAATGSGTGLTFTISGQGGRANGAPQQWAYATERTYTLKGDVNVYPYDLREASPLVTVDNAVDVRAERSWSILTNRLLRAAVLVDTTVP